MTAEPLYALLSLPTAYTAHAPQNCLTGCQGGTSDERGPVLTEPGQYLCSGKGSCTERLTKWLRAIPDSFGLLLWVKDHGTVPGNPESAKTKQPDPPAPMRLEVTDLLDVRQERGVLGIVHGWAQVIREERNQPAVCTCGHLALGHRSYGAVRCTAKKCQCGEYQAIAPKVPAECQLLVSNLPWIVEQPFAGDLYEEIRVLNRTLTNTVGDYRAKPVGKCPKLVEVAIGDINDAATMDVPCGGALVLDREGEGVRCVTCGNTVRADDGLRRLGLIVGRLWDTEDNQEVAS